MKRTLLAVAVISAFAATSASAADLMAIEPSAQVVSSASAYDWNGFYAGANIGYGWASIESEDITLDDSEGILGGAQVGYNYDLGGFVLGAEADFQLSDVSYEEEVSGVTARAAIDNFGTVRVRAGVAADRFLPYVTGGLAWANASQSVEIGGVTAEVDDTYVGWTIGAGLEYAVADNISVKGEYLYTDFGSADFGGDTDVNLTANIVRAGVNFQF